MKSKTFVAGLFVAISTFAIGVCSCEGLGFVSSFLTAKSSVRQTASQPSYCERASVGKPTDGLSTEQKSRSIPEGRAGIHHLDQSFNGEFYTFDSIELQTTEFGYDATGTWCERSVKPEAVMEGNDVLFDSIL
ncbi:MAG: hypothetical protein ABIU09_12370, partial [Pyrinomonadaceae bacterium]